jgi:hypothetical protein
MRKALVLLLFVSTTAGAYERPSDCADRFRVDDTTLGEPQYFLVADTSVVPMGLRNPIEAPASDTPEAYFEARFDSASRLREVVVHLDGPDHILSYEYKASGVVRHCRPVYRPPKSGAPRKRVGGEVR